MRQIGSVLTAALACALLITCGARTVFAKPMPPRFFYYSYEFIPALQPGPVTLRVTLYDTTGCTDISAEFFHDDNMGYSGPKTFPVIKTEQEPSVIIDLPVVLPENDTCGFWMKFESSCGYPQWAGRFWVTGPDSVEVWTHDVRVYAVNTREEVIIPDSSEWKARLEAMERLMSRPPEAVWPSENGRQLTPEEAKVRAHTRFLAAQKAHFDSLRAVGDSGWVRLEDGTKKKVDRNEHRREVEMQKLRELEKEPLEGRSDQAVMVDGELWLRAPGDSLFHKSVGYTKEELKVVAKQHADSVRQWADTALHDVVLDLSNPELLEKASRIADSLVPTERAGYYRTEVRGDKLLQLRKLLIRWSIYPNYPTPLPKSTE
ncbi:MAG: hypothetical protein RBT76_13595 [candidate division Zixibacteria bacterium]|jgi:hypothetical protein|nr:hypothetical protein [candidate division Zixibacteria bacterium]